MDWTGILLKYLAYQNFKELAPSYLCKIYLMCDFLNPKIAFYAMINGERKLFPPSPLLYASSIEQTLEPVIPK